MIETVAYFSSTTFSLLKMDPLFHKFHRLFGTTTRHNANVYYCGVEWCRQAKLSPVLYSDDIVFLLALAFIQNAAVIAVSTI